MRQAGPTIRAILGGLALAGAALAVSLPQPTAAQPANLRLGGGDPIEVVSDGGFEFHERERVVIARGGAVATQGDLTLRAETLAAFFRRLPDGSNEIYRLSAEGGVQIGTATQQAFGDRGVYDADQRVAVLTGNDLRLVTEQDTVTARESLEFWRDRNLAVARGDAVAIQGDNRVRAERLVGLLERGAQGNLELSRIDAEGGVVITTPQEVARGERGTYDLRSRQASLTGNVRITRGQNQLSGPAALVDLEAGTSRMLAGAGATEKVRGLFIPDPGDGRPPLGDATLPPAGQGTPAAQPAPIPDSPTQPQRDTP